MQRLDVGLGARLETLGRLHTGSSRPTPAGRPPPHRATHDAERRMPNGTAVGVAAPSRTTGTSARAITDAPPTAAGAGAPRDGLGGRALPARARTTIVTPARSARAARSESRTTVERISAVARCNTPTHAPSDTAAPHSNAALFARWSPQERNPTARSPPCGRGRSMKAPAVAVAIPHLPGTGVCVSSSATRGLGESPVVGVRSRACSPSPVSVFAANMRSSWRACCAPKDTTRPRAC